MANVRLPSVGTVTDMTTATDTIIIIKGGAVKQITADSLKALIAGEVTTDSVLSETSTNPVQNKAITAELIAYNNNLATDEERITALEAGGSGGSGMPSEIRQAMINVLQSELAYSGTSRTYTNQLIELLTSYNPLKKITITLNCEEALIGTETSTLIASAIGTYSDGTTAAVTGYTTSPETIKFGDQDVTVTYGGITSNAVTVSGVANINTSPVFIRTGDGQTANKKYASEDSSVTASELTSVTKTYSLPSTIVGGNLEPRITYYVEDNSGASGLVLVDKIWLFDSSGNVVEYYSSVLGTVRAQNMSTASATGISFVLVTADAENDYAYCTTTGDILFAGNKTIYYGCSNISEVVN